MKKLLDHFRRKRPEASAPVEQPAPSPAVPTKGVRPIATISVAPRTVRPAWQAATGPASGKRLALQPAGTESSDTLTLTLGDFWERLPSDLLASDPPDRSTPLPFDLAGISERIGRGDPGIPLAEIARRAPQTFRPNSVIAPDRTILFPWKAIHSLILQTRDGATSRGLTASDVEALSLKVRARRLRGPLKTAPAAVQPPPPTPHPETNPAPNNPPGIPEKLALAVPALLPKSEPAARLETGAPLPAAIPAPAVVPFVDQEHERHLAAIRAERDTAVAELSALRVEVGVLHTRAVVGEDALSAIKTQQAGLEAELAEATRVAGVLKAERDAAIARADAGRAEHEVATAPSGKADSDLTAKLISERDEARELAAKAVADSEAAMALAAEQTAERAASLARLQEALADRDAAAARAAELGNARERENSLAAELGGQMAAAVSHAAECAGERDAAIARSAELSRERDAAFARIAELEAAQSKGHPAPALEARTPHEPQPSADIEGCRNAVQALYAERDALRQEQQCLKARLVVAGAIVDKDSVDAAAANQPLGDAYGGLFPNRTTTSPLVIVLLMVLLAYGVFSVSKSGLSQAVGIGAPAAVEPAAAPSPVAQELSTTPLARQSPEPSVTLDDVTVLPSAPADGEAKEAPTSETAEPATNPLD